MAWITLLELNTFTGTNLSSDHGVTYLENLLEVVSEHVTAYCLGTLFERETISGERSTGYVYSRTAKLYVRTKHTPLISVSSLQYQVGSVSTTLTIDNIELDQANGRIELLWYGPIWRRRDQWIILTTYVAGLATIPDLVKMATALLVWEWVLADDATASASAGAGGIHGPLSGYRIGNYAENYFAVSDAVQGNLGMGTSLSTRAALLLRKYRKPGVASGYMAAGESN